MLTLEETSTVSRRADLINRQKGCRQTGCLPTTRKRMEHLSVRHTKTEEWEDRLKSVFDRIDDFLEDRYAGEFKLHPARPQRGETPNKEHSGLFNIGASFSSGFGSVYGPGYIVDIIMATLDPVPDELLTRIKTDVQKILKRELMLEFPDRELHVSREGGAIKIYGDLSMGAV